MAADVYTLMKREVKVVEVEVARYEIELLPLAMDLHCAVTGSGECSEEEMQWMAIRLRARLKDWREPTGEFDRLVKALVEEALSDYDEWLSK